MARLRPARTCRTPNSQAWARYSLRKPRKNFVRALPHKSMIFRMGVDSKNYDSEFTLNSEVPIQLRSNALEAARLVANKLLEAKMPGQYYFYVMVYPHNVIREHKMATGAGADRISQGMKVNAFGRPVAVAARVRTGQPILKVRTNLQNADIAKQALKRAMSKLSGTYKIITTPVKNTAS